jgi:thiamine-monophosphate kinase
MASPDLPRPTEDELIARYFAPLAGAGGLSLRDDAALLTPSPGHDLVLTTDAVVAGVHYFPDDPASSIACKALGVNLSDLAAKGAEPRGFLLTLALSDDWDEAWLAEFCTGLSEAAALASCPLLGGDTVRAAGATLVGITALGEVPAGTMVRRGAARPGDRILVSGTIGDAALGLKLRQKPAAAWGGTLSFSARTALVDRYLHPQARLALAPALRAHARAAMDVSDGLVGDLAKMMRAADLSAEVEIDAVPLSEAAKAALAAGAPLDTALTGGDDYEILCAADPAQVPALREAARKAGVSLTEIGTVTEGGAPPVFRASDGEARSFRSGSFSHF